MTLAEGLDPLHGSRGLCPLEAYGSRPNPFDRPKLSCVGVS